HGMLVCEVVLAWEHVERAVFRTQVVVLRFVFASYRTYPYRADFTEIHDPDRHVFAVYWSLVLLVLVPIHVVFLILVANDGKVPNLFPSEGGQLVSERLDEVRCGVVGDRRVLSSRTVPSF